MGYIDMECRSIENIFEALASIYIELVCRTDGCWLRVSMLYSVIFGLDIIWFTLFNFFQTEGRARELQELARKFAVPAKPRNFPVFLRQEP
jgi:hypothetical protein